MNMITKKIAQDIGISQALKAVTMGLILAYLIMTLFSSNEGFLKGLLWFTDINYKLNLLIAIVVIYICGYFYGSFAGHVILIKGWNKTLSGIIIGFLTLITSTFLASWIGFFQEGIRNTEPYSNPFYDYIVKPVVLVAIFGFIPVLLIGILFGDSISKKGKKIIKS